MDWRREMPLPHTGTVNPTRSFLLVAVALVATGCGHRAAPVTTTSVTTPTTAAPETSSTTPRPSNTTVGAGTISVGVGEAASTNRVTLRLDGYRFAACKAPVGQTTLAVDLTLTNVAHPDAVFYDVSTWTLYDHLGNKFDADPVNGCGVQRADAGLDPGVTVHPELTFVIPADSTGLTLVWAGTGLFNEQGVGIGRDEVVRFRLPE